MLPPPPRSTLFPYTTLFRSGRIGRRIVHGGLGGRAPDESRRRGDVRPGSSIAPHPFLSARTDRKSTRLNSSHRTISYAVFCLKKKKNKNKNHNDTLS